MNFFGQVVRFLLVGGFVVSLAGCQSRQFTVELEPIDEGMKRSLTFANSSVAEAGEDEPAYSQDELKKLDEIAAVYGMGKVSDLDDVTNEFSGVFANHMPQDLGGKGEYRRWKTTLGDASLYVERFRGSDDLLSKFELWSRNIDTIVDHLIKWLDSEIGEEDGFENLREFMASEFRRDLKNLGLYVWSLQFQEKKSETEDVLIATSMRVAQYFCERGYFAIEDVPEIVRAGTEYEATDRSQRLLKILQRLIASKMGVKDGERIPDCLSFIGHEKAIAKSIRDYCQTTAEYDKLLKEWEAKGQPGSKPALEDVLNQIVWGGELILFGGDVVRVKLKSRTEPFATNGEWDDEDHVVRWSKSIPVLDSQDRSYPLLAFALWAQPDKQVQVKHFGRVVLDEHSLSHYCVWYHGLDEGESKQWDSFLDTITPDSDFKSVLQMFRFEHEPPAIEGDDSNKDLAGSVRSLILGGLAQE